MRLSLTVEDDSELGDPDLIIISSESETSD